MAGIEECKALCADEKFMRVLDLARGQVGSEIRTAAGGSGYDPMRANKPLGLVIRRSSKGEYEYSRVGFNVLRGHECNGNNGMVCNFVKIREDDSAVAVLIGVPPNVRLESFNSEHFRATYKKLARETKRPVFIMGTGANAMRSLHITDGLTFSRVY